MKNMIEGMNSKLQGTEERISVMEYIEGSPRKENYAK